MMALSPPSAGSPATEHPSERAMPCRYGANPIQSPRFLQDQEFGPEPSSERELPPLVPVQETVEESPHSFSQASANPIQVLRENLLAMKR
jgi:hypothetical protein